MLEGELQRATAHGIKTLNVNLIFTSGFINADAAADGDLKTVLGTELDAAALLLEENAADLRAVVFQGEVDVAGLGFPAVGDFALDEEVGEIFREQIADSSREFADGKDLASGLEVEGELAHEVKLRVKEKDEVKSRDVKR